MRFANANSFKSKMKDIAKKKGVPAQQVQQQYLLEEILKAIALSNYKDSFILKGGYLIGQIIGLDKRTTMDLDVTLKGITLNTDTLISVFNKIVVLSESIFLFHVESAESIRGEDKYGGVRLKISASYEHLQEYVFIDITTDDAITPRQIKYQVLSVFDGKEIDIWSYNLETILAEKIETILSRGELSTRPRDRYDVFVLTQLNGDTIDYAILSQAIYRTAEKRGTIERIVDWKQTLNNLAQSNYQENLWFNYQKRFLYAKEISYAQTNDCLYELLSRTDI
ncbi:hypothetical protein HMPREF9321_1746 [Veillonella atypica ACS-049-V-Sch6]|uniref:Nucleotidyl transferase, PF08843 family n=1 Tax=Veillonella atypica ACS-049-V-Sch6 TaxID=866776 RepID=E1L7R4_9FIRM|nr:nucleotidyl transferase AbiEii/AbiGii toxin family protein [Veillonella atypica]EFL55641.1 hypothetical protein HMPREF9321_1746 [Veillonella atypica ACS-049-V-Sch6]